MASSSSYFACHSWPASPSPQGAPGWGRTCERTCSWLWAWRHPDAEHTACIPFPFSLKLEVSVLALGPTSLGEPVLWPGRLFSTAHQPFLVTCGPRLHVPLRVKSPSPALCAPQNPRPGHPVSPMCPLACLRRLTEFLPLLAKTASPRSS